MGARGNVQNLTNKGKGRPPGAKNKRQENIREAIHTAFHHPKVGGVNYLVKLANNKPEVFAGLLKTLVPRQVDVGIKLNSSELVEILHERRALLAKQLGETIDGKVVKHAAE